MCALQTQLSKI